MKKLLTILSMITFVPLIGTNVASCKGLVLGSGSSGSGGGKEEETSAESVTIITEDSEDLTIKPKTEAGWNDYYQAYQAEALKNQKDWQDLENDENVDPNNPEDVKFQRWFQDEAKIHEYWYSLIAYFALTKNILFEKRIDDHFDWKSIANQANLDYLIKLFNALTMLKTYDLAFDFFYSSEYKSFVLENKDIWEGNDDEQKKSQANWQKVITSLTIYQTEKDKWLTKVTANLKIVDPDFDFHQFLFLDYDEQMNRNDSKTLQILNSKDYQEIKVDYEKNDEYTITYDSSQGIVKIVTTIESEIEEINFVLKGKISETQSTEKEITIKINQASSLV